MEAKKMNKHMHKFGLRGYHCKHGGIMSLEEEVEMLEKVKEHLEIQLDKVNERLLKLKE
jgi:hypothetical protein